MFQNLPLLHLAKHRWHALGASPLLLLLALAALLGHAAAATAGPTGRIAYVADDGLYVQATSGAAPRRIVAAADEGIQDPRWSPDGSHIAYVGADGNIWVVNGDGSGAVQLTTQAVLPTGCGEGGCSTPGTQTDSPRWSPDGTRISYRIVQGQGAASLWTVALSGGAPVQLASFADLCLFNEGFSPSGAPLYSRCANATQPSNATFALTGSAARPLLAGSQLAFSPDGSRVAFSNQAMNANGIVVGLYVANADGSAAALVAKDGQNPSWSASGLLAYQVAGTNGWTVHVFNLNTGSDTVVAQGELAGWTSDGGWVCYTSFGTSGATIWLVAADGSGAHALAAGDSPACS